MFITVLMYSIGIPFAFASSLLLLIFKPFANKLLGRDRGRLYAIGSEVNKGKFTGVGIYFMAAFLVAASSFCEMSLLHRFLMLLCATSSLFGYLDDRSLNPWKEWVKGVIDIGIAASAAALAPFTFSGWVTTFAHSFEIPFFIFIPLAFALFIVSINATNATDGVDGLSGTLTILTVFTLTIVAALRGTLNAPSALMGLLMVAVLLPYLFFNIYPSKVLMGDAGSRGIGFFIALYAMMLHIPFAYLIVGLPFMLDGGLSILKITIGRLTHKKVIILKNTITPIHDHLKKQKGLSVPKTYLAICAFALLIDVIYIVINLVIKLVQFI
ncbi:MAG: phospho-N-acetylmuramoyl-pentapeptide-transferase [Clostridiales bacterium]|nr:phospho-N-acetylmuramoyl-pentapeptide-transferase [Clostridiales bacterium]